MIDIVAQARMDDSAYKRSVFILVPTVSAIPLGCEDISDEYFMQVETIVEDLSLATDWA